MKSRSIKSQAMASSRNGPAALLAAIMAAAAAIRFWRLDHFSYGFDEIMQTYFIQGTWKFFWESLKFDAVHPPLDYLIARILEFLAPADWARKIPAVLWGLGTILSLGLLIWRRAGAAAGLLTALLLAVAPFHVRYSQEFRPYSLGLFLLCFSMLLLDVLLARPTWSRLMLFFLSSLATMYTQYLAALVLGITAIGLLAEQAINGAANGRIRARRFLRWAPVLLIVLILAYLPWLPVVLDAAQRPSPVPSPPLTWERFSRSLSFFAFAPEDGQPLGRKGPFYLVLVGIGILMAFRRQQLRFLAIWLIGGSLAIEALEHVHPHWYVTRHFLAAGIVVPALAALPLAWLARQDTVDLFGRMLHKTRSVVLRQPRAAETVARGLAALPLPVLSKRRLTQLTVGVLTALIVIFNLRSLAVYFREGRPDWRTLGNYLKARPSSERIFTENQYSQLAVAFYTVGPDFLYRGGRSRPEVYSLEREPVRLTWSWSPNTTAWLVLAGPPPDEKLREWSRFFPTRSFPKAEGAILRRLDPTLWGRMQATVPRPVPKK